MPASIIRKDLIPRMQKDPNYLNDHKIRIFDKDGQELQSNQINWNSLDAVNYKFRQDPGGDLNSLGVVRININNPYGVYMHDTPEKGIFGDDDRFVSSGCIRVQNVRDYVTWLLKDTPGWDRAHIDEVIRSGERVDAKLANPVPVYWVYITAWATPEGLTEFREDIYQRDGFTPATADASTVPLPQLQPQPPASLARSAPRTRARTHERRRIILFLRLASGVSDRTEFIASLRTSAQNQRIRACPYAACSINFRFCIAAPDAPLPRLSSLATRIA